MPETIQDKQVFSLLEVTQSIQKTIDKRYQRSYWIKAEMNKLNYYSHSGHCYPELVEKNNGKIITQINATLWKGDYEIINENFIKVLKEPLKDGVKILICATIGYNPQYGLSLRIIDIDPSFTLGDLEKEKQEAIKELQFNGIFDINKKLPLSLLPQRIAIISVETSKGYADFLEILDSASRTWNYKFFHMLFPSLLQGNKAANNIIGQLRKIKKVKHHFDLVAIIRGGGGDVGLSCYNDYKLAKEIALFPIPVITGIGHATNLTVSEMVSYKNEITPTKLAEYIIQKFHNFSVPIKNAQQRLIDKAKRIISEQKTKFNAQLKLFTHLVNNILIKNERNIRSSVQTLSQNLKFKVKSESNYLHIHNIGLIKGTKRILTDQLRNLDLHINDFTKNVKSDFTKESLLLLNLEKNTELLNPKNILRRGFSITLYDGKSVKNINQIKLGDPIETILFEGYVESKITKAKKKKDE